MVFVVDSSVWINLHEAGLLTTFVQTGWLLYSTDLVIAELRTIPLSFLASHGVQIVSLTGTEVMQTESLGITYPRADAVDLSALYLARERGYILLSDDAALRRAERVTVHGTLWLLEQFVQSNILATDDACNAVADMLAGGARFPSDEVGKLRRKWGCP